MGAAKKSAHGWVRAVCFGVPFVCRWQPSSLRVALGALAKVQKIRTNLNNIMCETDFLDAQASPAQGK